MSDNIQVAIRVRPLIQREQQKNERELWKVKDRKCIFQESSPSELFCFDRVFHTKETNQDVYDDICLPIVRSVMQGFNGTVFAYGQTSSGKTFTMMGEQGGIKKGVIHLSIEHIFGMIQKMTDRQFLLRVSFLEIYNEKVYDLLSEDLKNEDLKIFEDSYGNITVNGLQEKIVLEEEQIWDLMHKGQSKRRTGATKMNQVSSRSHFIFRMIIESRVKDDDAVNVSQLNLVDLAGSENLKQSNTRGERFKEGVHINLSLSTLIQVISQLSEKDQFINYRNSKLTRLLQNSLGGNALTAIICAVTPTTVKETLSTLNFAQRAKKIKNKPMKNEIFNEQALLKQYANKIKKLSRELYEVSEEKGKELAEKIKQNENLKRQIDALTANFVSQTANAKSKRRETYGGRGARYNIELSTKISLPEHPISLQEHPIPCSLPTLKEDTEEDPEESDIYSNSTRKSSCSSIRFSVSRNVLNAETQTEYISEPEPKPDIDYEGCMKIISELKCQLRALQTELSELAAYTTLEKQIIKADRELQTENEILKNENACLRKRLDSVLDELHTKSYSSFCALQTIHESSGENYEGNVFNSPIKSFSKDCQTSPLKSYDNIDHLYEQNSKLELCNQDLSHKIHALEASYRKQSEEFETAQSEWNAELLNLKKQLNFQTLESNESKYNKEMAELNLQLKDSRDKLSETMSSREKYIEFEECDRDLRQKLCDIEVAHCIKIKTAEAKYEAAQSELLSMAKKLEVLQEELTDVKHQLKNSESSELGDIKQIQEKYCEEEEYNRDLGQKLSDSEAAHCIQIKAAESKHEACQSELHSVAKDLGSCRKELAEIKHPFKEYESFELDDTKDLKRKYCELEECNRKLKQKVCDLEAAYSIKLKAAEVKYETAHSELGLKSEDLETYQKELAAVKNQLKEAESQELSDLKYMQEKCSNLVQYNSDLRKKITDLEDSHFDDMQQLQEKYCELEECNRDLRQKLSDSEAVHYIEIKAAEAKYEAAQSELLSMAEKLEVHQKELADIKHGLEESETRDSSDLKLLQQKYSELEECNRDLRQKLSDSEAIHCIDIKAAEEKYEAAQSDLLSMSRELEVHKKELADIKHRLKESESFESDNMKDFKRKYDELEECNRDLKQKLCDLEAAHSIKLKAAEAKYETAHSELCLMAKDLKTHQEELAEVKNQLKKAESQELSDLKYMQEKCSSLVQYNSDLKKKIIDLEDSHWAEIEKLEENFKVERAEWESEILKKFKDLETGHRQELNDLETKVSETHMAKFNETMQVYIDEACKLREEVEHLKQQNLELSAFKQDHSKRLKELKDQVHSLTLDKLDQNTKLIKEKEEALYASMAKYEKIITEYKNRQRQCRDINRQLTNQVKYYKEELERMKKGSQACSDDSQNLEEKVKDLALERDNLLEKYKIAKQEIHELKSNFEKQIESDKQKNAGKNEELEERCKMLSFDLDQKKAKIISLETNNARMIQEIKKLNDKLSSKHVPCKCELNAKGLKKETLETHDNFRLKIENEKLDGRTETKAKENCAIKQMDNDDAPQKDDDNKEKVDQSDPYLLGGGSGPANMVKCYWLEGILYKKDKEIKKLQKEIVELKSELATTKARPVFMEQNKPEKRKFNFVREPLSPLRETNDVTSLANVTPPQYQGAVPTIIGKHGVREKCKRNCKPYEHPPKAERHDKGSEDKYANVKENIPRPQTSADFIKMISEDMNESQTPDCKQQ